MEASSSNANSMDARNSSSPLVQFARYVDGRLQLFQARTSNLHYIAISHVWGKTEWLEVPGIDHEILVSRQKALFIEKRLPSLVGGAAFWMDTLTVNQRDKDEVIATVQAIPAIFRDAVKTIAVREGDGLYDCCLDAVRGFTEYKEFLRKLAGHTSDHWGDVYRESYLQRLWTLQECFLSHTIQFVQDGDNKPKKKAETPELDLYAERNEILVAIDSLWALAHAFHSSDGHSSSPKSGLEDFIHAYLFSGTITHKKLAPRGLDEDIYSGGFREEQLYSNRSATQPRDYIFATMPQFPWYHYPAEAEHMSFNAIFEDFYKQAKQAGHAFVCRITRSMTELTQNLSTEQAWYPSGQQPEPSALGDFIKLLGQRVNSDEDVGDYHLTTPVTVTEVNIEDLAGTVELLESAMRFSFRKWHLCHRGGELAKYGSWPQGGPKSLREKRSYLEMIEEEPLQGLEAYLAQLRVDIAQEEAQELDSDLLKEARRTLDIIWHTVDPYIGNTGMKNDGYHFKQRLLKYRHPRLLEFIALLMAMVSCQVPLSAEIWARRHFIPVRVGYKKFHVIGLLAKHAVGSNISSGQVMVSAGRHSRGESLGKDLVIVDPVTKMPVGLLPDFLDVERTGEEFREKISALYNGFAIHVTPEVLIRKHIPLDAFKLHVKDQQNTASSSKGKSENFC